MRRDAAEGGERPEPEIDQILRVREGHGANCSSIGSVVDTLFATATVGAAVFAAVLAALRTEDVRVVSPVTRGADEGIGKRRRREKEK